MRRTLADGPKHLVKDYANQRFCVDTRGDQQGILQTLHGFGSPPVRSYVTLLLTRQSSAYPLEPRVGM
jgi:hypothetical protein